MKELKDAPNGARYSIYVVWLEEYGGSAHVFIAEKENGFVRYVDPQVGSDDVRSYFEMANDGKFGFLRMDNKKLTDDIDIVKQTMENSND